MDGSENVVLNNPFADQNGVFVIVAVPRDKPDQNIASESQFAVVGRRPVGQNRPRAHLLADRNHRPLIETGVLVGSCVFLKRINPVLTAVRRLHLNPLCRRINNLAVFFGLQQNAGVVSGFPLHSGSDNRRGGKEQRHRLPLHV